MRRLAAVLLLAVLAGGVRRRRPAGSPEARGADHESQAAMTPASALERLEAGNARFASNATKPRDWSAKVIATAAGQYPFAAVLACMDSRAPSRSSSIRASATSSAYASPATS